MPKNLNIVDLCDFYGNILTPKQYELLRYYYDNDYSLAEIAQLEGITPQGVRDIIKRAEQKLIETEEKLQFCAQHREIKLKLSKALDMGDDALKSAVEDVLNNL